MNFLQAIEALHEGHRVTHPGSKDCYFVRVYQKIYFVDASREIFPACFSRDEVSSEGWEILEKENPVHEKLAFDLKWVKSKVGYPPEMCINGKKGFNTEFVILKLLKVCQAVDMLMDEKNKQ